MTPIDGIDSTITVLPTDDGTRRRAMRAVAALARDTDDARLLLDMLGLT